MFTKQLISPNTNNSEGSIGHPNSSQAQMDQCLLMIRKPVDNAERFEKIWHTHVIAQAGAYEMNR